MDEFPIEVHYVNKLTKEKLTYHLRICNALEDDSLVVQMSGPEGKPNDKEVWVARFVRDYKEFKTDDGEKRVKKLSRPEWMFLMYNWNEWNTVTPGNFLELPNPESDLLKKDSLSQPS